MKLNKIAVFGLVVSLLAGTPLCMAQDHPKPAHPKQDMKQDASHKKSAMPDMSKMPKPVKEHAWLAQFAGEWDADVEMHMAPDQPPQKSSGTETARMIGGFWILAEYKGDFMDQPFTGIMSVGFDPEKHKYVGTWIDSKTNKMWQYEGKVDAAGKTLTMEAEGPCPMTGEHCKFKDVTEFKDKDHKVFTSQKQGEDGKWVTCMKIEYRRKK